MHNLQQGIRNIWVWMLEPPWQHTDRSAIDLQSDEQLLMHWSIWLIGWAWTLTGLAGGALVAPALVQASGMSYTSAQDWLVIAIAVVTGLLVQMLGLLMVLLAVFLGFFLVGVDPEWLGMLLLPLAMLLVVLAVVFPVVGVGYGIYRYLDWVGASQREVTIAFVGGLLVKTFAIPLVKGIVTGALFRWFMKWLHTDKDTKNA